MENRQELPQRCIRDENFQDPVMRRSKDEQEEPRDYMTYMAMVQTILCILLFGGLLLFSKISVISFDNFKNEIRKEMSYDAGISGVKNAFKNAVEFAMASPNNWKNEDEEITHSTIPQKSMRLGKGGINEILENGKAPTNMSFAPYTITAKISNPLPEGKVSSPFGFRKDPISGRYGFHGGLDIAAPEGSRIAAAYNGTVKKIGEDDKAGKYVLLEHSDGLATFYCHCSELLVETGENIRAGETIAKVGSTGYSTGPHLHFEIRIGNIKYNPLLALDDVL